MECKLQKKQLEILICLLYNTLFLIIYRVYYHSIFIFMKSNQVTLISKLRTYAAQLKKKNPFRFTFILLGKLFIQQYRIVQFVGPSQIYLRKMIFTDKEEYHNLYLQIFQTNQLIENRKLRVETFAKIQQKIGSVPSKGSFNILFIYLDNSTFSYFKEDELNNSIVCQVEKLKNNLDLQNYNPHKKLHAAEIGELLHKTIQNYIQGAGFINNQDFKQKLCKSKCMYNLDKVINTINYIIGCEMIAGGYQIISTQKQLECNTHRNQTKFNRLDLILRNEEKVLVIDWKFTRISAQNYMKTYQHKIQKYLLLAKKYFNCDVEFHLYCIHTKSSNLMHFYSTQKREKYIPTVQINDQKGDDIESLIWYNSFTSGDQDKKVQSSQEKDKNKELIINIDD